MMNDRIDQTDLNLAINYMVMERLTKCMGVDEYLFEEHDWLPVVFKAAAKGSLKKMFMELGQDNKEGLVTLFEKLHNIFGLDGEVLSGERQINLGIEVDPQKPHAVRLSKISMYKLNNYIEIKARYYKRKGKDLKFLMYDALPWINTVEGEQRVNELVTEQIGNAHIGKNRNINKAGLKWASNPLGLNTLGLFIYVIETIPLEIGNKKIQNVSGEVLEEALDCTYEKIFSNIKLTDKKYITKEVKTPEGKEKIKVPIYEYTTAWKQNIYSFDSIVYSILRRWEYLLEGYSTNGRKAHKFLDEVSDILPTPLKLVDRNSDLFKLIDTLWETNCDSLGGYNFNFKYTELIRYSSIQQEIKHYKTEVLPFLEAKRDVIVDLLEKKKKESESLDTKHELDIENAEYEEHAPLWGSSDDKRIQRLNDVIAEIQEIATVYIPALEESKKSFETDKEQWIAAQVQIINSKKAPLERRKAVLESNPTILKAYKSRKKTNNTANPTVTQAVKKLQVIDAKLEILKNWESEVKKKANGKKPKPWIEVREPYYIYVSLDGNSSSDTEDEEDTEENEE